MLNFLNDYSKGCFPEILEQLSKMNFEQNTGYGTDPYSRAAADKIRKACDCPEAEVAFISGGTQTNQLVIASLLDSFDGVLCADSGHINVHEAGAIELTGHKVMSLSGIDGKISGAQVEMYMKDYYDDSNYEHMVRPAMVYISHPSEIGTLYTKSELQSLRKACDKYKLPIFLDGARMSAALTADGTDLSLKDIAALTDVFYIGGTKCGALYGEALVWTKNNLPFRFVSRIKQHGALLAKGWVAAVQFDVLFDEQYGTEEYPNLYIKGGINANKMADQIKSALKEKGYRMYVDSPTNQIFIIADKAQMDALSGDVVYSYFEKYDDEHAVIRFCTDWATTQEQVDALIKVL